MALVVPCHKPISIPMVMVSMMSMTMPIRLTCAQIQIQRITTMSMKTDVLLPSETLMGTASQMIWTSVLTPHSVQPSPRMDVLSLVQIPTMTGSKTLLMLSHLNRRNGRMQMKMDLVTIGLMILGMQLVKGLWDNGSPMLQHLISVQKYRVHLTILHGLEPV